MNTAERGLKRITIRVNQRLSAADIGFSASISSHVLPIGLDGKPPHEEERELDSQVDEKVLAADEHR